MPVKTDQPPLPTEGGSYLYDAERKAWVRREGTKQDGFATHKTTPAPAEKAEE